jgi:hypothetical protein
MVVDARLFLSVTEVGWIQERWAGLRLTFLVVLSLKRREDREAMEDLLWRELFSWEGETETEFARAQGARGRNEMAPSPEWNKLEYSVPDVQSFAFNQDIAGVLVRAIGEPDKERITASERGAGEQEGVLYVSLWFPAQLNRADGITRPELTGALNPRRHSPRKAPKGWCCLVLCCHCFP